MSNQYAPKSATGLAPRRQESLLGKLQLVTVTPPTKPVRAFFPAYSDLVRMHYAFISLNHIAIGSSNATAISLVPTCIAKISTPGSVTWARAFSLGNLPLPPPTPFSIVADFDEACDGGFHHRRPGQHGGSAADQVPARRQPGADAQRPEHRVEKHRNGTPNRLALQVKENGAIPIAFNEWRATESLTTTLRPRSLYYSAELMKTGAAVVPGTFSQQITILVTFR